MKYVQPYGISDPDASYVNGDPSIGRAGSIPPANSIEHPQREIVKFITDSGLTPANAVEADLHQLAQSVQAGKVTFGATTGNAPSVGATNHYAMILTPALQANRVGMSFRAQFNFTNNGPSDLSINGLTALPIVMPDFSPLLGGELLASAVGTFVTVANPGPAPSHYMLTNVGGPGVRRRLAAPTTIYVNPDTGNNANNGLTAATAFRTLNYAYQFAQKLDLGGNTLTFNCLANNLTSYDQLIAIGPITGQAGPQSVIFRCDGKATISHSFAAVWCFNAVGGAMFTISGGWEMRAASVASTAGGLVQAEGNGSVIRINGTDGASSPMNFRSAGSGAQLSSILNGNIILAGSYSIANETSGWHWWASAGVIFSSGGGATITLNGTPSFTGGFANSSGGTGYIGTLNIAFSGSAVGKRFNIDAFGWIYTNGQLTTWLPGDTAGTIETRNIVGGSGGTYQCGTYS